jgi:glycosyltransferase involved in cell wall biosynthesis
MPQRTLITTCSGIGLGILGQRFADMFPDCWDEVLAFPTWERTRLVEIRHPRLTMLPNADALRGRLAGRRVFFFESSYRALSADTDALWVPMAEQAGTDEEIRPGGRIIAPNEWARRHMRAHFGIESRVLRLPFDARAVTFRRRGEARVWLHNAGSLGARLRKGTDLAIQAWQRSGLGHDRRRLRIHSWLPCPANLRELIDRDPHGIEWTGVQAVDPRDLLADADVLLHTARLEGDAMTTVEAMASGIPAIVPNYAPCNEVVTPGNWRVALASSAPAPWYERALVHEIDVERCAEVLRWSVRNLGEHSEQARESAIQAHDTDALREAWREDILR